MRACTRAQREAAEEDEEWADENDESKEIPVRQEGAGRLRLVGSGEGGGVGDQTTDSFILQSRARLPCWTFLPRAWSAFFQQGKDLSLARH